MSADDHGTPDPGLEALLEAAAVHGPADGPEVLPETIRRWRAGDLDETEAASVEARLAHDPAGRAYAAGLGAALDPSLLEWAVEQMPEQRPLRAVGRRWVPYLALAAALVLAVGVWRAGAPTIPKYDNAISEVLQPTGDGVEFVRVRGVAAEGPLLSAGQRLDLRLSPAAGTHASPAWLRVFRERRDGKLEAIGEAAQSRDNGGFVVSLSASEVIGDATRTVTIHILITVERAGLDGLHELTLAEASAQAAGAWQSHVFGIAGGRQ